VSHFLTRQIPKWNLNQINRQGQGQRMSYASMHPPPMNEEIAIACIMYVSKKENIAPQEVLWGIVPLANRQTVADSCQYEKEPEQAA